MVTAKVDWSEAHAQAFEFFGGVPEVIVFDQLRSAVSQPCRYEPVINASYQHMAAHYKTTIVPARPLVSLMCSINQPSDRRHLNVSGHQIKIGVH